MSSYRAVCPVARLPLDSTVTALVDGARVAVVRRPDGTVLAYDEASAPRTVRLREGLVEVALTA